MQYLFVYSEKDLFSILLAIPSVVVAGTCINHYTNARTEKWRY